MRCLILYMQYLISVRDDFSCDAAFRRRYTLERVFAGNVWVSYMTVKCQNAFEITPYCFKTWLSYIVALPAVLCYYPGRNVTYSPWSSVCYCQASPWGCTCTFQHSSPFFLRPSLFLYHSLTHSLSLSCLLPAGWYSLPRYIISPGYLLGLPLTQSLLACFALFLRTVWW